MTFRYSRIRVLGAVLSARAHLGFFYYPSDKAVFPRLRSLHL